MLLLWNNSKKTGLSSVWGKKCMKFKKLNHFASICRSKHKVIEIDDTNSNAESDADITLHRPW